MPTTTSTTDTDRRYRRRIIGWGLLAFGAVAIGGAVEGIPRAERDLERRVTDRLADNGITGVHVEFSGQDATLRCEQPLADPGRAERLTEDLWGVRVADLDRFCTTRSAGSGQDAGAGDGSGSATAATTAATDATDEVTDTTDDVTTTTDDASGGDTVKDTTEASPPTTDAAPPTTDASEDEAPTVGDLTVELLDGRLVLTGTVADEAARAALLDAAAAVVDPANIDDRLELAGAGAGATTAGVAADDLDGLVALVRVMPPNLVAGTVTRLGDGTLSIEGTYADDAGRDAIAEAADDAGLASADVALEERAEATASDAAGLTAELNDFVAANPIRFQPNSAILTPEASAVVDQVAAIANRYAGVAITVEGHTDTDGDANRNFGLSADRADTVRVALLARGVTAPMEIAGLGETQPILVNGVEDKAASRRVVFKVSAT